MYAKQAAYGISFSTFTHDTDSGFKEDVLGRLRGTEWNEYISLDTTDVINRIGSIVGIDLQIEAIWACRGAEAAFHRLCAVRAPDTIYTPFAAYPGFRRVAASLHIDHRTYRRSSDLDSINPSDIVVLTIPCAPIPFIDDSWVLERAKLAGATIIVDATFSLLDAASVTLLVNLRRRYNAYLIISVSKSLGLAALRLGFVIGSPPLLDQEEGNEWDAFQCAALDTLCTQYWWDRLSKRVGQYQQYWKESLGRVLAARDIATQDMGSSFFTTVSSFALTDSELSGLSGYKSYPGLNLVRVDVNQHNAEILAVQ